MNTPVKKLNEKETFQVTESLHCSKLKEYLLKRNMRFEEQKTGKTTTIVIRRQEYL
jgi:hypothetical protein